MHWVCANVLTIRSWWLDAVGPSRPPRWPHGRLRLCVGSLPSSESHAPTSLVVSAAPAPAAADRSPTTPQLGAPAVILRIDPTARIIGAVRNDSRELRRGSFYPLPFDTRPYRWRRVDILDDVAHRPADRRAAAATRARDVEREVATCGSQRSNSKPSAASVARADATPGAFQQDIVGPPRLRRRRARLISHARGLDGARTGGRWAHCRPVAHSRCPGHVLCVRRVFRDEALPAGTTPRSSSFEKAARAGWTDIPCVFVVLARW